MSTSRKSNTLTEITFAQFKSSVGGDFASDLLKMSLKDLETWDWFQAAFFKNRSNFSKPDDADERVGFYDYVQDRYGVASTGEKALILAILHAIDYSEVANDLEKQHGRTFFRLIGFADRNYRLAAAACIARVD